MPTKTGRMTSWEKYLAGKKKKAKKNTGATVAKIDKMQIGKSLGFPRTKKVMMKYTDNIQMTGSTGGMTKQQYGANCVFDPYLGAGGHQPFGWDQMIAYYNHAYVKSSSIKVELFSTDNTVWPVVGVYLSDDGTSYTDWRTFSETNRGTQKVCPKTDPAVTICKYKHSSFFKGQPLGQEQFANNVASNPSEKAEYHIYVQDLALGGNASIIGTVEILYEVEFSEPKDLVAS